MMDESGIYEKLRELFVADIMERIIPGAIHNLANPMGGITGRVQLMQARIARNFGKLESSHPDFYREFALDKIVRDVEILSGETETLLSIFRNFEEKFLSLSVRGQEPLNLPQMIEAEMKFADFYLDFKHNVIKKLDFGENVPAVYGERAGYSLGLAALVNSARLRMNNAPQKELAVSVDYNDKMIRVVFRDTGEAITGEYRKLLKEISDDFQEFPVSEQCLGYALLLFDRYGFQTEVTTADGRNVVMLRKPC